MNVGARVRKGFGVARRSACGALGRGAWAPARVGKRDIAIWGAASAVEGGSCPPHIGNRTHAYRAALHQGVRIALRVDRVRDDEERDPQPRRLGRVLARQHRSPGRLEPGRGRRARAEIFPQGRRARAPEARRGERRPLVPVALRRPTRRRSRRCPRPSATARETSARQVFDRLAGAWTYWGWKGGYFDGEDDARAFYDEMRFMLARQMAAPNSPQWFNTGLHWAYGIDGPGQGHYYVDFETGKLTQVEVGLRASAAARLLHPVGRRRPRQRGRHHGPVGARGAPVQIRLRHRLQLLHAARREREALGRRPLVAA